MSKLLLDPAQGSIAVKFGAEVVATQLAGGKSRLRRDQLGAAAIVDVEWYLEASEYDYLMAFHRYITAHGSLPFTLDMVLDHAPLAEYSAQFVPETLALSAIKGTAYIVGAQLEIVPRHDPSADLGTILAFTNTVMPGIMLWLNFENGYVDAGPYQLDGVAIGDSEVVNDGTRGLVHQGVVAADRVDLASFDSPPSYTKTFWAKKGSENAPGSILGSTSTHENIRFSTTGTPPTQSQKLTVTHNNVNARQVPWTAGTDWAHVAVTYDAATGDMGVFINGFGLVTGGIAQRSTLGPLHASGFNGADAFNGKLDELRLYSHALSPAEVLALYEATSA